MINILLVEKKDTREYELFGFAEHMSRSGQKPLQNVTLNQRTKTIVSKSANYDQPTNKRV